MIVRILKAASGFPAVNYNTGKVNSGRGELMKVSGFGALQALRHLRPQDYKNHLAMVSAANSRVKCPQLHAVISAEGRSHTKEELTNIASQWLEAMGYGTQPYLIVFHQDTANHHVHLVTTRIDAAGKKISDSFEKLRAVEALNRIVGLDEQQIAREALQHALSYRFSTAAQFRLILEQQGYQLRLNQGNWEVIRLGRVQEKISAADVDKMLYIGEPDQQRHKQLQALFHKYLAVFDSSLMRQDGVYTSAFATGMKRQFGLQLCFHSSGDKPPYGYTLIDHQTKQVFKGGLVMPLSQFSAPRREQSDRPPIYTARPVSKAQAAHYRGLLMAAIHHYPDLSQGLADLGLHLVVTSEESFLHDPSKGVLIAVDLLLTAPEQAVVQSHFGNIPRLAGDIDDEAIHGRNRRRKRKARTNTR